MPEQSAASLWIGDGPGAPRLSPDDALVAAGIDPACDCEVTLGWTIERLPWAETPTVRSIRTTLAGYGTAAAVNRGRVAALPVRLSAVPALLAHRPPDVAVVAGVRRGAALAFGRSVGWADVLARTARRVVVEVDDDQVDDGDVVAGDLGGPPIEGNVVAVLVRPPAAGPPAGSRAADEVDVRIGELVASLLPQDATLQFGPGGIGEGIACALDRPVRLWSGLVTDSMASLHGRGLLLGPATAAYTWGGEPVRALAGAGRLQLRSSTMTHDLGTLAAIERFVACNTALQVGLDGAVNVEQVGGRVVAAVGGHADFCAGAVRSPGGMSVIALRSTTPDGSSTIVPSVEVVSTSRSDVQVVVTEHGIADLRGIGLAERARRLVTVAAPQHRDALAAAADAAG